MSATKALFIGINEYQDLNIDNLEGARLDAIALHALFTDSIPGIQARLLTDRAATKQAIEDELQAAMDSAMPGDFVIVTFSGHGSAEEGLVAHDSVLTDDGSMISMANLATRFHQTRAGRVLVLLDCCESGEGPRRVLKTWTDTSGVDNTLHSPDGGGRSMIAAANPNQSAWETSSVEGHGLLTASLMQVLTEAEAPVDVRVLSATIAERVRAEAARSGDEQTPIDISVVAGNFHLPPLRAGDAYRRAFPERSPSTKAEHFQDLETFGIAPSIVALWESSFPSGLNELQKTAINRERLLDGKNLLVVAPTGSGKTLLGEMAAMRTVSAGRRAAFLVPLRALAAEKHEEFQARYGSLDLRVIRCTGDFTDSVTEFLHGKYDVALLTYEMFLSLVLTNPSALVHLGAVVIDEAHFITDPERGITVELLLTLLVGASIEGPAPQLIALSAVIGKINHFDDWLGANCLQHLDRPVPLVEGVLDRTGVYQYLDVDGTEKQEQLVARRSIFQRRDKPSAQDVLVPLVQQLVSNQAETVLVFRGVKGRAAGTANYIAESLNLGRATSAIQSLPAVSSSTDSELLRKCLDRGTAFHNSNLVREERAVVEHAFRDAREVRVLASTTTLAAGINTPASTVIIVEHEFPGNPPRDFRVAEYKNMAGRAGRPGFGPIGRSILYADNAIERARLFRTYVLGEPEGVQSSFDPREIDTWLIRLLRQVGRIEEQKVVGLLANTFGGYMLVRRDASWQGRTERELLGLLDRMKRLGLVEEFRGHITLTRLGEACGQASLAMQSCLQLVEMLKRRGLVSASELMVLVQCLDELDEIYTPLAKANKKGTDREWSYAAARIAARPTLTELARGGGDDGYQKRCKRSLVLNDWAAGIPMLELERRYSPHPFFRTTAGTVRSFADTTRFHLRSAADIAKVVFDSPEFRESEIQILLDRLELGLAEEMLELAKVARSLTREELISLIQAGFRTSAAVASAADEVLAGILGEVARVALLRKAIPASVVEAKTAAAG
jgi:replicative superfamily II helicase